MCSRDEESTEDGKTDVSIHDGKTDISTHDGKKEKDDTTRRRKRSANKNEEHVFPLIDAIRAFI